MQTVNGRGFYKCRFTIFGLEDDNIKKYYEYRLITTIMTIRKKKDSDKEIVCDAF